MKFLLFLSTFIDKKIEKDSSDIEWAGY